jgi:hypothetical protein
MAGKLEAMAKKQYAKTLAGASTWETKMNTDFENNLKKAEGQGPKWLNKFCGALGQTDETGAANASCQKKFGFGSDAYNQGIIEALKPINVSEAKSKMTAAHFKDKVKENKTKYIKALGGASASSTED